MLGIRFSAAAAGVEERRLPDEAPRRYVERLAREKACAAAAGPDALIVAGDTVVVCGGRVLEKPNGPEEAAGMLAALSGRSHDVYSGLALARGGRTVSAVAAARVVFRSVRRAFIDRYVETGEPLDKAGAYGIQGRGSALVKEIEGDYFTVVGLSVAAFVTLLPALELEYVPGEGVVERANGGAGRR